MGMYIKDGKIDKNAEFFKFRFTEDEVSFGKCIEAIIDRVNKAEDEKNQAIKQLKEFNKDEEIQKLKKEIEILQEDNRRGFPITEKEYKKIKTWMSNHNNKKHKNESFGAIDGQFAYKFNCTSIGAIGTIECMCGDKFIFQDI